MTRGENRTVAWKSRVDTNH